MYEVGHIFLGAARRGIAILFIGIGLSFIGYPGYLALEYSMASELQFTTALFTVIILAVSGLVSLGFWVWQIHDARKVAKLQAIKS